MVIAILKVCYITNVLLDLTIFRTIKPQIWYLKGEVISHFETEVLLAYLLQLPDIMSSPDNPYSTNVEIE